MAVRGVDLSHNRDLVGSPSDNQCPPMTVIPRDTRGVALVHRAGAVNLYRRHTPDRLPVTCWCELEFVLVPPAKIRRGETESCGLANCHP